METTIALKAATSAARVPLPVAAERVGMTSSGLLKLLTRAEIAIRDDGRWYVGESNLKKIESARNILGMDKKIRS